MYVYFIQRVTGGPVKIGKAERPDRRLSALQVANLDELVIRAVCLGGRPAARVLHDHFAESLIRNEWFEPTPALGDVMDRLPSWDDVVAGKFCPEIINENRATITKLYDLGYTFADVAEVLGCSRQRAHQLVRNSAGNKLRTQARQKEDGTYERVKLRPPRPEEPVAEAYARLLGEHDKIEFMLGGE